MADLKIPNLNNKSDKFFFKKKLSLRRKSKRKLIKESFVMLSFSFFFIYLIYVIPNKKLIFNNFSSNLNNLVGNILNSFSYSYELFLAFFIIVAIIFVFILIVGAFSRFIKILKRKSSKISFK